MLLLIAVLAILLVFVMCKMKFSRRHAAFATFPSPPGVPFFHNLFLVLKEVRNFLESTTRTQSELGEVFLMTGSFFDCGIVIVADPVVAEAVSLHQPDRTRSAFYESVSRWIGEDGYFLSPEKRVQKRMKIFLKFLNSSGISRSLSDINKQLDVFVETLQSESEQFDVSQSFHKFALDLVFKTFYDFDLNSMNGKNQDYVDAVRKIVELGFEELTSVSWYLPLVHRFTKKHAAMKQTLKILHEFSLQMVQSRHKNMKTSCDDGFCLLDSMLQTPVDGSLMTEEEVNFEVNFWILANHDTIMTSSTFLLYALARYPAIQEKVFTEINERIRNDCHREITEEDLRELPYLEAVIKETLRLFPPIPFVSRKLRSEKKVDDFVFPEDVEVLIAPFLIMRNPKYFNDPLTFHPDRFLNIDCMPLAFTPFSIGARKCAGVKYAYAVLKMMAVKFLINHRLELPEDHQEVELKAGLVLSTKAKIFIKLEKRNSEIL